MRRRSSIGIVLVLLLVVALFYYFYGYRNRNISTDLSTAKEFADNASTTSAVKSALALNKQVSALDIHVESVNSPGKSDNNVTLTGLVPTADDKRVAEDIARSTTGVASVVNNIEVEPTSQSANLDKAYVPDLEIRAAVLQSILNNPSLKSQQIKVAVHDGKVILMGSVQSNTQKADAESSAKAIANVRDVDSKGLTVTGIGTGRS